MALRPGEGRLYWLALVGGAATLLYAALAWAGTTLLALPAALASIVAYALAALFSYLGHHGLTFRSDRPHREAAPRFAGVTAAGYLIALLAPWALTDRLGAHPLVAILLTCVVVPVLNVVALSRLVFRAPILDSRSLERPGDPS